ncbi:hypothetical protein R6Q57_029133 [Mikania cordata]
MSWWDGDFFFGQHSDVSRVAETYHEETGVQSSKATNRPVLPDLNEEVAGQTSYEPFVRAARVTRIRDPLIRYLHRCIASSLTGRGMSHEWCTSQYLFF